MTDAITDTDTVENRSEIVLLYDAVDCNPNGNPLSGSDRPRIDAQTQQAIVTDVRLKRYLRDQLADDGHHIFVNNVKDEEGHAPTREALLEACVDVDGPEDVDGNILDEFLDTAADVRYFGATLSIDADDDTLAAAVLEHTPAHIKGAVQFGPGRTMNQVEINEEYNALTSVIATGEDKEQGGFDLDDHRIKYGVVRFHGVVDENAADTTQLTDHDVRRLDTLCWRALKNQTLSRSKVGQEPRLYLRVEYGDDSYHAGDLDTTLAIDVDHSTPEPEMRDIGDVCIDIDGLAAALDASSERIDAVHVVASPHLAVSRNGDAGGPDILYDALRESVGDDAVHVIDVYDQHTATLPEA